MSATPAARGPLAGLRVLELADEKGQFCGKLMADLGADVIKVEPPGGQKARAVGPFVGDVPHPDRSLSFWHYNTSKRGVTLNLETEEGRALLRRLAATADVVLETFPPGYLPSLGLGYDDLKQANPRLVMCSLTPFGQTGPWSNFATSDLLHMAAGGQMASCGYDEADVPNAPPIAPGGGNAWHMGCHYAYIAIVAALVFRTASGQGQYIDASVHDACALTTEGGVAQYIYNAQVVRRQTGRHASPTKTPSTQFRCRDGGYVNMLMGLRVGPRQFRTLVEWMDGRGLAQDLTDERYQDPAVLRESMPHIHKVVTDFIANLTQDEAYHGFQERGFAMGAVRAPEAFVDDPHLRDRGFFVAVEHPELGRTFTYPGAVAIYNKTPWGIQRRPPLVGEHNEEVYCQELGLSRGELVVLAEAGAV